MNSNLFETFAEKFCSGNAPHVYFCPGRVNLIGEHIDYNGGFVFPGALTLGITALIRKRTDGLVRFASLAMPDQIEIDLSEPLENKASQKWANFPIGVLAFLKEENQTLSGADVLYSSTLPDGAGVSSSAAIEVLTTYMFLKENGNENPDRVWISRFAQSVENKFIGVNCGIMDQFAVANGKANQGILLNCSNLDHSFIPLELGRYKLVILNTNKRRELAESKYNERRAECDKALLLLQPDGPFKDLCSANPEVIENRISDPVLKARAKHVVSENSRVMEATEVLKEGNLSRFGQLLNESHYSLRDDYEVTGKELDAITDFARRHPSCLGARMTGAGFGGCAIALVDTPGIEDFMAFVGAGYTSATGLQADFYISEIGEGVSRIN